MSEQCGQLALDFASSEASLERPQPLRREQREQIVRLVEYTPFPRVRAGQRRRLSFTRDVSQSGMCLGADAPEPTGSLLRIIVRCVDGRPAHDSLGRVQWCAPDPDGGYWIGVALLCEARRPLRRVRLSPDARIAIA